MENTRIWEKTAKGQLPDVRYAIYTHLEEYIPLWALQTNAVSQMRVSCN